MADTPQVALVTGAAGNLGRAVAAALAARGMRVAALDRAAAPLEEVVAALPDPAAHLVLAGVDLMDPAACDAALARVQAQYGRIDAVAHTVGGFAFTPIVDSVPTAFEQMFRLNLLTTANVFGAAIARMRPAGRGALVAIGAMAALKAPGALGAYAASKAGVLRLVESYADELRREGLRVNAVLPGTIDTPQNRAAMPDADTSGWVTPAQLAEAIAFLLSDAASGITGALLPVTGRG
jgi:NAD(P)-dependent dehydrogenase (short-subunit alcohol dehydrogenase family)